MIRVLFVCLGNICRSPAAEAAFARIVAEAKLQDQFEIDSAGTGAWHVGEQADRRMRQTAERRGLQVTSVARQVVPEDFDRFDHIFAMDAETQRTLLRLAPPECRHKVRLFRDFDTAAPGQDVPDPYYGDAGGFDDVLDIVTRTGRALLLELTRPAS